MFIRDADGQLLNLDHVACIRPKLMKSGVPGSAEVWDVVADRPVNSGSHAVHTLARGFPTREASVEWLDRAMPGVLTFPPPDLRTAG